MKVNGDLIVLGKTKIKLEKTDTAFESSEVGRVFINESGKLCVNNGEKIVILADMEDIDLTPWLGGLISKNKNLNIFKLNMAFKDIINIQNKDTLLEVFEKLGQYLNESKKDGVDQLIKDAGLTTEQPYLKFNGQRLVAVKQPNTDPSSGIRDDGILLRTPVGVSSKAFKRLIVSDVAKDLHIITHDSGEKYCFVQVMDLEDNLIDPSEYAVQFVDINKITVKFDGDRKIKVLITNL